MNDVIEKVSWFTQRITMILVSIIIVVLLVVYARLLSIAGVWQTIDTLYESGFVWLFWLAMLISRVAFAALWGYSAHIIIQAGRRYGFFWFKPTPKSDDFDANYRDVSAWVILAIVAVALVFVIVEACIRIATGIEPPYLT